MEHLTLKVRIAILWLIMAVVYAAHMALSIFEPEVIELILDWEMEITEAQFIFSVFFAWLIPLTMAFLSVTLKDAANRWANIVMGVVFTIGNICHLLYEQFTEPSIHMAQPSVHQLLLNLSTVIVTALVVWYACRWPKQKT